MKPTVYFLTDGTSTNYLADAPADETPVLDNLDVLISLDEAAFSNVALKWELGDALPYDMPTADLELGLSLAVGTPRTRFSTTPVYFIQPVVLPQDPKSPTPEEPFVTYVVKEGNHYVGRYSRLGIAFGVCCSLIHRRGGWLLEEILPR